KGEGEDACIRDPGIVFLVYILNSLSFLPKEQGGDMTEKAAQFLFREQTRPGVWRFVLHDADPTVLPDLDTNALVSSALQNLGYSLDNQALFLNNRNDRGEFRLWAEGYGSRADYTPFAREIDCGTTANVLYYLGDTRETRSACELLVDDLLQKKSCSLYYRDPLVIYYFVARAYHEGSTCLKPTISYIQEAILSEQKEDGSFGNSLQTAVSLSALLDTGYDNELRLLKAVSALLRLQKNNGSWERGTIYSYTRDSGSPAFLSKDTISLSEDLSTAFSLEALAKFGLFLKH
ncbi:MAG: hypothetical protein AAB691_02285, partial [Patescibacteria group bacterium]